MDRSRSAGDARSEGGDHPVGLAPAHESGAAYWDRETKQVFALDRDNSYSITAAANTEKRYRDPAEWLLIKTHWSLTYTEAELAALQEILLPQRCD